MEKYVCKHCGSENIQIRQWTDPNTNEQYEWVDDENYRECWCDDCQEITEWEKKKDMTNQQKASYVLDFMADEWDGKTIVNALNQYLKDEDLANLYDNLVEDGILRE